MKLRERVGATRIWARVMKHLAPPIDRVVSRLTGGRATVASLFLPTFVVEHRGARSGRTYRTPLSYLSLDDGWAIAGSNFGQAHHPAWTKNLTANPDAVVEVDGERSAVRAERVSDAEKAELWPRFVKMWPAYGNYEIWSGDRNIRVFRLRRR